MGDVWVPVYEDQVIRITDLVVSRPAIEHARFERCLILGPAVLVLSADTQISNSNFQTYPGVAFFVPVDVSKHLPMGMVNLIGCQFDQCEFQRISLAGPESVRAMVEGGMFP